MCVLLVWTCQADRGVNGVQANVGNYEASARYYVRALLLNSVASNVWGYLRNSLACAGLMDLVPAVEKEDLTALERALPL